MKTSKFILTGCLFLQLFTSCVPKTIKTKTSLVDFEYVTLNSNLTTSDTTNAKFISGNAIFTVNQGGIFNGGIVCSAQKDSITPDYTNQFSAITASGALEGTTYSNNYAVLYAPAYFSCPKDYFGYFSIESLMVTNSTYAYRTIKNGNAFSRKFGNGDWFKVIIKGFKNEIQTGSVEYFLADFRDGKNILLNKWAKVDLTSLGEVDKVSFNLESSDVGQWGMNTPAYVCIDNIYFKQSYTEN